MQHLFTRTTSQGKQIDGYADVAGAMGKVLIVHVDGVQVAKGAPGVLSKAQIARVPAGYTHIIGSVPLLTDEIAAYNAATVAQPRNLHAERRDLVLAHNAIAAELDAARRRAWDAADEVVPLNSAELDAARAAIAAFDAAHPEVKAAIDADRNDTAERNRWM